MSKLTEDIKRIKKLMCLIKEDTQEKTSILIDGTSSAGKSFTAEILNAVPFFKSNDTNQWVVIDSDHFAGSDDQSIENRIKYDHKGYGSNPQAGEEFHKEMAEVRKGQIFADGTPASGRGMTTVGFHKHPHHKDIISGTDSRNWYMAQEFKYGGWNKVIFDDIGNGIVEYVPNVKNNFLIHAPIHILMKNLGKRNISNVKGDHRNPINVLEQYLEKYEATSSQPNEKVGDPKKLPNRVQLQELLYSHIDEQRFPKYTKEYIDSFLNRLGITNEGNFWIKVKGGYLKDNTQLINVDDGQVKYLEKFKNLVNT